ncbi:sugar phosphate isomerase/epimerase [Motilibacter sp. K478]|nr:sugar phosphate isomerase/epimerase [Motilibacter aurantiacus]
MAVAAKDTPSPSLGLQLFSVRNAISSLGFAVVFETLAQQGYKEVEFAGYTSPASPGITIPQLRQLLDDNGLKAIGSHISLNNLLNAGVREQQYEIAVQLGMPYIGTANDIPGQTVAEIQAGADRFNAAADVAATYGLRIYQHNHANEFAFTADQPNVRRYTPFINRIDWSRNVFLEMDILWAYGGARKYAQPGGTNGLPLPNGAFGFDPANWVAANPERYRLFHAKDGTPNADPASGNSFTPSEFGAGTIDFRSFFAKVGARYENHPLWEQDNAPNTPAELGGVFGASRRSYLGMFETRTLTWLDEMHALVGRMVLNRQLTASVGAGLQDRLDRAISRYQDGHEESAMGYLGQFVAKVGNQVRGFSASKAMLLSNADMIMGWLQESEDRELGG